MIQRFLHDMWLSLSSLPTAFYFVHSQSFPKQIFINTIISDYRLSWSFTASPPLQFLGFTCHYAHVAWESRLRDMIAWMSWTSSAMEEIQAHWMEEIQAHWSDLNLNEMEEELNTTDEFITGTYLEMYTTICEHGEKKKVTQMWTFYIYQLFFLKQTKM